MKRDIPTYIKSFDAFFKIIGLASEISIITLFRFKETIEDFKAESQDEHFSLQDKLLFQQTLHENLKKLNPDKAIANLKNQSLFIELKSKSKYYSAFNETHLTFLGLIPFGRIRHDLTQNGTLITYRPTLQLRFSHPEFKEFSIDLWDITDITLSSSL